MGAIARFDLPALIRDYGLMHFVETGTGKGDSLAFAASISPGFESLQSCELNQDLWRESRLRFLADERISVVHGRSGSFVTGRLMMLPSKEPVLFFLDAHFPGADYGLGCYGDVDDSVVRLPLQSELDVIKAFRPFAKDVIVIDDLRIYEDGPYQHGNVPADVRPHCPAERGIGFIEKAFGDTHDIERIYAHEGYLLLTPKGGSGG